MSVYSFREGSVLSVVSNVGSTLTGKSSAPEVPEDPLVAKERKKLYGIGKKYEIKTIPEDQLVMFDPEVIHIGPWRAKFEKLLESREIEDEETKKAILFKALLPQTVNLIPTFFRRHEEPMEKDTEVILKKIQDHYEKIERKHRIKARIRFFNTSQGDRSFYEFANDLKAQLFECNFGSFEEDALVMVFVQGLSNSVLKKHLLEKELWLTSLIDTVELAIKFQDVLPSYTRGGSTVGESIWDTSETIETCSYVKGMSSEKPCETTISRTELFSSAGTRRTTDVFSKAGTRLTTSVKQFGTSK